MELGGDGNEIDQRYAVDTAVRTLALLEAVGEMGKPAALNEIVSRLDWTKPAVYRLLRTLESVGALRRTDGKHYVLGPKLIVLGQAALRATGLADVARAKMEELQEEVGETIVLSTLDYNELIVLDRVEAKEILRPNYQFGDRLPAYCTSSGRVLMSDLSDDELRERLKGVKFVGLGPRTPQTLDEVLDGMHQAQKQGYALNDEELTLGHRSVAAPIRDHTGAVVASMSVSVPSVRVSVTELRKIAKERLIPAADAVSAGLAAPAV
jgi:IclR family transcriptional regulator, pca regulon regulatory protein